MATKIAVLPTDVVSKIAAGEVVERPASVVKELVENAVDAGASRVDVEASAGGKSFVRVSDDGEGMCREDAVLAFQRHATSKVRTAEDLEEVQSLGFRGEALPSVAAVARVELVTSDGHEGTQVIVDGGTMLRCESAARARGTTVVVRDLFHNVPARRKYLGSERSEARRVTQTLVALALARPDVGISWKHDERVLLRCPSGQDLATRAVAVLGKAALGDALEWTWEGLGWRGHALLGSPHTAGTTRRSQYFAVNGRPAWSQPLMEAVGQGYRHTLPEGRHAAVVLHLTSTGGRVDANVHPAKREVRFPKPWNLASALGNAIQQALAGGARAVVGGTGVLVGHAARPGQISDHKIRYFPGAQTELVGMVEQSLPRSRGAPPAFWQLHRAYILSAIKGGLVVIDQHAAHERVLYEEALQRSRRSAAASQQLLFPILVELPPAQAAALEEQREALATLGLVVRPFGDSSYMVEAVPPGLENRLDAGLLREFAADLEAARRTAWNGIETLAKILACHTAVRVGQELSEQEMQSLVDGLFATRDPQTCPHGRPTFFRISLEELGRKFRRR